MTDSGQEQEQDTAITRPTLQAKRKKGHSRHEQAVSSAISADELFSMFKNHLEGKLVENNKDIEEKSKIEKQVSQMKFKGNQCQFELNAKVEGILDKIKEENAGTNTPIDKLTTEGKKLIKKRQKLIRIADKAKDGRVVEEYVSDELASDTEDEKRL
ncbi:hypothetical protein QZH41_003324 [Actinostola sp. cb2023]|nr:hypothetical protein QZH41_003324 [Actinostola sp. cb2023]